MSPLDLGARPWRPCLAYNSRIAASQVRGLHRIPVIARLRPHVDAFFDKVTVNVADGPDAAPLRANRLALLSEIRAATLNVADLSKIAG